MADEMNGPITRCPWCSAELPIPGAESCVSCGAALVAAPGTDRDIKGVTSLDPEAILRARSDVSRPRSRILSFITGEVPVDVDATANPESLAPPDEAVRREMLRLQMAAERADLEAETVALKSDVLAQRGITLADLAGDAEAGVDEPGTAEAGAGPSEAPGTEQGQPDADDETPWPVDTVDDPGDEPAPDADVPPPA
jgi:hypothetical protein